MAVNALDKLQFLSFIYMYLLDKQDMILPSHS